MIWDEAAVLRLIQQDFPWFLDTYLSYPRLVQRSDVSRYMVLYKYGGVYLDADVSGGLHPQSNASRRQGTCAGTVAARLGQQSVC